MHRSINVREELLVPVAADYGYDEFAFAALQCCLNGVGHTGPVIRSGDQSVNDDVEATGDFFQLNVVVQRAHIAIQADPSEARPS